MKTRVLTGAAILPIIIIPLFLGGLWTLIFVALLSCVATYEYNKAFDVHNVLTYIVTLSAVIVFYVMVYITELQYLEVFLVGYFIALLIIYVINYPTYKFKEIAIMMCGFMYTTLLMSYIAVIRLHDEKGIWYVWFIFLISFGSDIFGYLVGRTFGKHKLTPRLSPKKTVEGAFGSLFGGALFMVLFGLFMFIIGGVDDLSVLPKLAALGALGATMAIIGDLVASGIKRTTGIKDFGKILPGHGGIIDRFDSSIIIAPVIYYLVSSILGIL